MARRTRQAPTGVHPLDVTTANRYGRIFNETIAFKVVEEMPDLDWYHDFWRHGVDGRHTG